MARTKQTAQKNTGGKPLAMGRGKATPKKNPPPGKSTDRKVVVEYSSDEEPQPTEGAAAPKRVKKQIHLTLPTSPAHVTTTESFTTFFINHGLTRALQKAFAKRDCKYTVSKVSGNRAISLGGYLWAVSSIKQEQLQVRCLEETHMIEIQPPLQIVYLGNGCEGYSPSMFLPAKNEMTTHAQIESRREYFLQFNYVYTPDRYIGLWWQFRTRMMSEKEARAFITQVAPLGTMDYSLLHKRPPMIKTNYGFSWPVPPATLVIGVVVIILFIAGIALGCYVYRMRKTFSLATGTIKKITDKPLSGCCRLFSRMHKRTRPVTSPRTIPRQRTIEDTPEAHAAEIHPVQMTKILRDVFQDPQLAHKYTKHLDKKVQVDSFASQEPEIVPDPENPTDTPY